MGRRRGAGRFFRLQQSGFPSRTCRACLGRCQGRPPGCLAGAGQWWSRSGCRRLPARRSSAPPLAGDGSSGRSCGGHLGHLGWSPQPTTSPASVDTQAGSPRNQWRSHTGRLGRRGGGSGDRRGHRGNGQRTPAALAGRNAGRFPRHGSGFGAGRHSARPLLLRAVQGAERVAGPSVRDGNREDGGLAVAQQRHGEPPVNLGRSDGGLDRVAES